MNIFQDNFNLLFDRAVAALKEDKPIRVVNSLLVSTDEHYHEIKRIYDGVEVKTRKYQASFQIIQVSFKALPRMRLE